MRVGAGVVMGNPAGLDVQLGHSGRGGGNRHGQIRQVAALNAA